MMMVTRKSMTQAAYRGIRLRKNDWIFFLSHRSVFRFARSLSCLPCLLGAAVVVMALALRVGASEAEWRPLELDRQWSFVGGDWQRDARGVLTAPGHKAEQNLAFHTGS